MDKTGTARNYTDWKTSYFEKYKKVYKKYETEHDIVAFNYKMPNINAVLGIAQRRVQQKGLMAQIGRIGPSEGLGDRAFAGDEGGVLLQRLADDTRKALDFKKLGKDFQSKDLLA